jgi:PAS domain S-box-containing protein
VSIDQIIEYHPLIIAPETTLKEAIALLGKQEHSLSDCALVMAEQRLIGMITSQDLVRLVAQGVELSTTTTDEVMSAPVIAIADHQCANIQSVLLVFRQHSISHLPILAQNQKLVGIISANNLIKFLASKNEDPQPANHTPEEIQPEDWHKKAESIERFFDFTPSIICVASFDGYFKRTNPAFQANLGFTDAELLTQPLINFVHPEDRAATIAEVDKLTAGKTTISFENRYRTKDGNYRWLLWTAKPDLEEQTIFCIAQDVTAQKQAETLLLQIKEQFRILAQKAPVGIFQTDAVGNCLFVNLRWQQMTGLSDLEARGEGWSKALHPDDRERVFNQWRYCAQTNQEFALEYRFQTSDEQVIWVFGSAVAHYDNEHEVSGYLGSVTDITEQKIAMQNRQQAEIKLRQQSEFSHAIINTVASLVTVLDRSGVIISFNRTCEQVTGYSFKEVKGRLVWDLLIAPEEKATFQAVFQRLLAGQLPNQYENYWLAKDGNRHLISWSNTALFDAEGTVEFVVATGIDVTEQRQVWNKLEQQYRQTKLLTEITRKIRMSIKLKDILQAAVTEVQQLLACDRVLVMEIMENVAIPISESILPDLPPMLGYELADPLLMGTYLAKYRQGKVLAIDNLATADVSLEVKLLLEQFKVQAKLVVPILAQQKLKGLIVVHQCYSCRQWQQDEIQLLKQLADQIGVALSQAELLDNLEELVSQRTNELTTINSLLEAEITERKQTEARLRENEQKLSGILDNADEAIISIDEQQRIQLFNHGAENIFGYQAAEIIGRSLDLLLPEAFRQVHRHHVEYFGKSTQQSRQMVERSTRVFGRRQNGQEFPAEASVAKLHTRQGMLFTVMLKDITERQQTQAKLQASKALLVKAEAIAKIGSWEYDHELKTRSWSDELFNIMGFDKDGSIPSCAAILKRIHPQDRLLVKKTLIEGHQQGKTWELNYRLLLPNGTLKYLESRGEPTVDLQGKVLKVLETIMDVSDRIQAEKSRQRSEAQLRLITDALPVLIAYIDHRQQYQYVNRTYETWYGQPCSSLLGQSIRKIVKEDNYQTMLPYIETALSGKALSFESQCRADNGSSYWISATYVPDFDSNGLVKGFFSMIDDITERKIIEQMKSEFISIASHEMRTPLTSIHGVIKLLCGGRLGELSPTGQDMANMALRNSDRLVRLVNDILDLERMESGKDEIEQQQCSSLELIQQAIDTLQSVADEQQICLLTNNQSITLFADRDRIIQTLTNLISNAIKFSAPHGKVWITSQLENNQVIFTVKDQGRGIPSDKLETIFERFQQVDASDSRKKGGTGLGLAICKHIVAQHQGKIWAESVYGRGSKFFFALPF